MINSAKNFFLVVVCVACVIMCFYIKHQNATITKLQTAATILKEDEKSKVTVEGDKIIVTKRVEDKSKPKPEGAKPEEKIVSEVEYLPPESKVEVVTDLQGNTEAKFNNKGFCFEVALCGTGDLQGFGFGVSSRLLFWDRYGAGVGLQNDLKPFVFVDRRVKDFVPFLKNTSVGVKYNGDFGIVINVFV